MFRVFAALAFVVLTFTPHSATAGSDGFWNAKYKDGQRGELDIAYTQLGDLARLEMDIVHWNQSALRAKCVYAITLEAGQPKTTAPIEAASTLHSPDQSCPKDLGFQVGQTGQGMLTVSFQNPIFGPESFRLFGVLRNPIDIAPIKKPWGFDILGIAPNMTRSETEATLFAKGYSPRSDLTKTIFFDGDYKTTSEYWGKGPNSSDTIILSYSPLGPGVAEKDPNQKVVVATRDWTIPPSEALSAAVLKDSLNKKYGTRSDESHDRFYTPDGVIETGAVSYVCAADSYIQDTAWRYDSAINSTEDGKFKPNCGVSVAAHISTDQATGQATRLVLTLKDGSSVYRAFWTVWAAQEQVKIKEMASAPMPPTPIESPPKAPEL